MAKWQWSPLDHAQINDAFQDMLTKGIIESGASEWVSEPYLVRKDDERFKFCVDFCLLNCVTLHDWYPLPCIDNLLDQLGKFTYFTSLDLAFGYW